MHPAEQVPKDKVRRLVLLIAITFAVLSVVTLGSARARLDHHRQPPAPTAPQHAQAH